jgi:putative sugar O-methyltransferase
MTNKFTTDLLYKNFIETFPKFVEDTNLNLDSKHQSIVNEISNSGLSSINLLNIRNWDKQNDLGAPLSLRYLKQNRELKIKHFIKLIYQKSFGREKNRLLKQSLLDDLQVLRLNNALNLLANNPVSKTPGKTIWMASGDLVFNMRWLRYIYLAQIINKKNLLPSNGTWIDVGSFYGGLQGIVKKVNPDSKIIMVDFHHQLYRSYIYLTLLYPDQKHFLGITPEIETTSGSFHYIPVQDFNKIPDMGIDLFTNFFSFGEMLRKDFSEYIGSNLFNKSKNIYTVNRFVSAPFFEPAYDSDLTVLDYNFKNHQNIYFDIFPMHHFQQIKRNLFGILRARNVSSPYFELIATLKSN